MVSYTFSNTTLPRKSNPDQIGGVSLYTDDFNMSKLIVNRTDQNSQYFEIEFSEDLDLIQVQSHNVYHYEAQSGADAFELKSHEDYLELTSNPMIVKVLETYPYVISLQLMPDKILPAQSFMQIEEQVNVTKNIFGIIPFQFKDFTTNKIKFDKITEEIKPVDLNQLRSEQKNKVNKFRLSLVFDFTETIVTQSYFTTVDIFSQLGGLFASIVGILTKLGVVYLIQYNLALS